MEDRTGTADLNREVREEREVSRSQRGFRLYRIELLSDSVLSPQLIADRQWLLVLRPQGSSVRSSQPKHAQADYFSSCAARRPAFPLTGHYSVRSGHGITRPGMPNHDWL